MTILITNDDGIDAPGIDALKKAVSQITDKSIVTVAPKHHLSGCSHQVNIRTEIPVVWRSETEVSVDSTPADCIRLGVNYLYEDIHFVVSGINAGCNLGSDMYPSGTIAATREATLHGLPAIAFSHFWKDEWEIDWTRATKWAVQALKLLLAKPFEPGKLWSINFPHLLPDTPEPELIFTSPCTRPLLTEFVLEGSSYRYIGSDINRRSEPGTDVDVCLSGNIAISQIQLW